MVRIRLMRVGSKGQPSYRVIAVDREAPRDSKSLETLGFYNPRTNPETVVLKEDRIFSWIDSGAKPSDSVTQIFKRTGLLDRYDRFKQGESIEVLMEEAEAAEAKRNSGTKTTLVV